MRFNQQLSEESLVMFTNPNLVLKLINICSKYVQTFNYVHEMFANFTGKVLYRRLWQDNVLNTGEHFNNNVTSQL